MQQHCDMPAQGAIYPPSLFPAAVVHPMQAQSAYDEMHVHQHAGREHHHANGMVVGAAAVERDSCWMMKARGLRPDQVAHQQAHAFEGAAPAVVAHQQLALHGVMHPHRLHTGGDLAMSMADAEEAPRAHHGPTHAERTLDKWEHLLRTKPDDPMAFYWREMIQWCKVRGSDTQGGGLEATGVKRAPPPPGSGVEEGVEVIDRLVKRIRCDDGPAAAHPGPWA
uniref:Uncharacterized protein n=1 Tax=Hemiselmis tepida TaxID=464990 RepID=A0A7S0YIH3_9CRYP